MSFRQKKDLFHQNNIITKLIVLILFMFLLVFLGNSALTIKYAYLGLDTWYKSMIPALFPFMFLMNYIIKNDLTTYFIKPASIILKPIFRINDECIFVILFGFLCGFPLGAKSAISLYQNKKITKIEAQYLLSFTNNLGPAYITGFVFHNILSENHSILSIYKLLLIAFGIPFIYGILLRYTIYLNKITNQNNNDKNNKSNGSTTLLTNKQNLISTIPLCLSDSLYQIGLLGGYMILFNTIRVIPILLFRSHKTSYIFFQCLLEISGGLICLKENISNARLLVIFSLTALSFGGLSCYFQTNSLICDTNLSSQKYMLHKLILCSITFTILFVLF